MYSIQASFLFLWDLNNGCVDKRKPVSAQKPWNWSLCFIKSNDEELRMAMANMKLESLGMSSPSPSLNSSAVAILHCVSFIYCTFGKANICCLPPSPEFLYWEKKLSSLCAPLLSGFAVIKAAQPTRTKRVRISIFLKISKIISRKYFSQRKQLRVRIRIRFSRSQNYLPLNH